MNAFPSILEGIGDLQKKHVDHIMERAKDLKSGSPARLPLQKTIAVATSFLENSTRTKLSFAMAIKRLKGFHIDFVAETSSLKKGESLEQTLLTLKYQGIDICIIRTKESHLLEQFREHPPIKIINGGDGTNQHPTQALLDLYTLQEKLGDLNGKTVSIVGDCKHSRVTHSLIDLLPQYGIKVKLCGPTNFLEDASPASDIEIIKNFDEAIEQSDALYMLRIQNERHGEEDKFNLEEYIKNYQINFNRLIEHKKAIPIFHPGPANIGVEVHQEIIDSELWMAHKQVENSVYVRMAIIEAMINNDDRNIGYRNLKIPGELSAASTK
jgi:aspartate carbamoyltransferase catalytic subunit